jgi:subtilisin family serine protease
VEKPKRLFFSVSQGKIASCISSVQLDIPIPGVGEALFGKGILVAVIDSGVDYTHPEFRNADGSSRIRAIWDQSVPGAPPKGYVLGSEYTKEEIDEALRTGTRLNTVDISGHGTAVLGIAAGNNGVAAQAERRINIMDGHVSEAEW